MICDLVIRYKSWPKRVKSIMKKGLKIDFDLLKVVDVLAKLSLVADVVVNVNTLAIADFWKLSLNVEAKSSEFANVHTTSF